MISKTFSETSMALLLICFYSSKLPRLGGRVDGNDYRGP